jgi:hypothetical protein
MRGEMTNIPSDLGLNLPVNFFARMAGYTVERIGHLRYP